MSFRGYPTTEKSDRISAEHPTIEPVRAFQSALSVLAHSAVRDVTTDAVEAGSTTTSIVATAHSAQRGDVIRITSGALSGTEVKVQSVTANAIELCETLPSAPAAAVTFTIRRHAYMLLGSDGSLSVSSSPGPVQFVLDGVNTEVEENTGTPADSNPLPVALLDPNGVRFGSAAVPLNVALPAATETKLDTLIAAVDGLEGMLDGLEGFTDGLEALIGTTNTTLSAIQTLITSTNGYVDGLEALATTLNGYVDGLEGMLDSVEASLTSIDSKLSAHDVIDFIDSTPVLDTSSTAIPSSASSTLTVVASLAATVQAIQVFDTTGQFIGIYTGAAASEVLQAVIGPGMDGTIPVNMASGSRVSVRNMAAASISSGKLAINFLG